MAKNERPIDLLEKLMATAVALWAMSIVQEDESKAASLNEMGDNVVAAVGWIQELREKAGE